LKTSAEIPVPSLHGSQALRAIQTCVHCGFCNAVCPTYRVFGDELEGPRGRIYLIKDLLESRAKPEKIRKHLDRCLLCRACETACPSGVKYHELFEFGRVITDETRPAAGRFIRWILRKFLLSKRLTSAAFFLGRIMKPFLPHFAKSAMSNSGKRSDPVMPIFPKRKMLILKGCVQPGLDPEIDRKTIQVFSDAGIRLDTTEGSGCCGALSAHMGAENEAKELIRRNIDEWFEKLQSEYEALLVTATGCGSVIREYSQILADDEAYRERADYVGKRTFDPSVVLLKEKGLEYQKSPSAENIRNIAVQNPCTLQHSQNSSGILEQILQQAGFNLVPEFEPTLCCGSAGSYSILNKKISLEVRTHKIKSLMHSSPEAVVSSNIGCLIHLRAGMGIPVFHWIELIEIKR